MSAVKVAVIFVSGMLAPFVLLRILLFLAGLWDAVRRRTYWRMWSKKASTYSLRTLIEEWDKKGIKSQYRIIVSRKRNALVWIRRGEKPLSESPGDTE